VLNRCEAFERLQAFCEVVGGAESLKVFLQLSVGVVIVPLHGSLFQCPVHAFCLSVGPRMVQLGETMLDAVLAADPVENVHA